MLGALEFVIFIGILYYVFNKNRYELLLHFEGHCLSGRISAQNKKVKRCCWDVEVLWKWDKQVNERLWISVTVDTHIYSESDLMGLLWF